MPKLTFTGNLNITVADTCFVTCPKTGLKVILTYLEEGWLGKTQNRVEGVIYKCDVEKDKTTRIQDVPEKDVVGRIEGAWTDKIYFSKGSTPMKKVSVSSFKLHSPNPLRNRNNSTDSIKQDKDKILLADLNPLWPAAKIVPPAEQQLPNESRKFWDEVTTAILDKQYSQATSKKQDLEERQREKAADRKARNVEWRPRFFTDATKPNGRPELSEEGRKAIDNLHKGEYHLDPSKETGA